MENKTYSFISEYWYRQREKTGRFKIITECFDKIVELGIHLVITSTKEKYWWFMVEYYWWNDEVDKLIRDLEDLSYETCMACWAPGESRGEWWIKTMCDNCYWKSK